MAQIINFGTEENPINVKMQENHPEFFVDGSVGLAIGFPVSKIVLTSSDPHSTQPSPDDRKAVCTVVMNTDSLIDMAKVILTAASTNKQFLEEHSGKVAKRIMDALDSCDIKSQD